MSSLVGLAAWMPATRAVASASPLGRPPAEISATTSGVVTSAPAATAVRLVTAFAVTSTMWAAPCSSRWESRPGSDVTIYLLTTVIGWVYGRSSAGTGKAMSPNGDNAPVRSAGSPLVGGGSPGPDTGP